MAIDEGKARDEIQKILFEEYNLYELVAFGSRGFEDRLNSDDPENGILLFSRDIDKPCDCTPLNLVYYEKNIFNWDNIVALRNRVNANSYIMGRGSLVEIKELEGDSVRGKGIEGMLFPITLYSSRRSKTK